MNKNILIYKWLPKNIKINNDVLEYVIKNGIGLQYINIKYIYNRELLIENIINNIQNIKYIPIIYKYDITFYKDILKFNKCFLKYVNIPNILLELILEDIKSGDILKLKR